MYEIDEENLDKVIFTGKWHSIQEPQFIIYYRD